MVTKRDGVSGLNQIVFRSQRLSLTCAVSRRLQLVVCVSNCSRHFGGRVTSQMSPKDDSVLMICPS